MSAEYVTSEELLALTKDILQIVFFRLASPRLREHDREKMVEELGSQIGASHPAFEQNFIASLTNYIFEFLVCKSPPLIMRANDRIIYYAYNLTEAGQRHWEQIQSDGGNTMDQLAKQLLAWKDRKGSYTLAEVSRKSNDRVPNAEIG